MIQRIHSISNGYRARSFHATGPKGSSRLPDLLYWHSGYREERDWSYGNRHLKYLVEFIFVNVGGSPQDVKASSLPMPVESVGGVIVLRTRESRVHGEGRQFVGIPTQINQM